MKKDNKNKKKSFFYLLLVRLFGSRKKELSILEEEQVQSPLRSTIKQFKENKLSMTGLIVFLAIFAFAFIGPYFFKLDLSFSETSQQNIAPGLNLMSVPKELKDNAKQISVGPVFSVGVSNDGKVYVWGKPKISRSIDASKLPMGMGKVVKVAAGYDHVIALDANGDVWGWGSDRLKQSKVPEEVEALKNIKDIAAGYQCSFVITEDGYVYFFGNDAINDFKANNEYQGQISKVAVSSDAVLGLTFDGRAVYLGKQTNAYSRVPENMGKVVDIAATAATMAAVNDEGKVFVWGNVSSYGEGSVPETDSKIVSLQGGRYHYTALTDSGDVVAWGANGYKQAEVPGKVTDANIKAVYTGFYQNYAITDEGTLLTWGLKGYPLGTDDLGRDILNRLINGGKMSMTIGAVSVIISTIVGVIIGCISGFFGGKVDMILQRIVEIVSGLPFLPFAMILSALIGNNMTSNQKIFLIMVILGLLQWPTLSRLIRAQVLAEREKEFVTAARSIGVRRMKIVFRHILPNVISVVIVTATLDFATCMLTEATLSYLGFGVPAPQPTWGNMLFGSNNSIVIQNYWWRWVFASIILSICVICINLTGDGLRDAVDPKSRER
jgi:peptide/nickel transport system permease protein